MVACKQAHSRKRQDHEEKRDSETIMEITPEREKAIREKFEINHFPRMLGIEIDTLEPGRARLSVEVRRDLGVEDVGSWGTWGLGRRLRAGRRAGRRDLPAGDSRAGAMRDARRTSRH